MICVEAPTEWNPRPPIPGEGGAMGVFLAGGITGCPDWQAAVVRMVGDANVVLLNPRRENFPMDDPKASLDQILWEHDHSVLTLPSREVVKLKLP